MHNNRNQLLGLRADKWDGLHVYSDSHQCNRHGFCVIAIPFGHSTDGSRRPYECERYGRRWKCHGVLDSAFQQWWLDHYRLHCYSVTRWRYLFNNGHNLFCERIVQWDELHIHGCGTEYCG